MPFRYLIVFLIGLLCVHAQANAQQQSLTPKDYAEWQQISQAELSPNGQWFAYTISLVDGDGWLTLKKAGTDSTGAHKFMHGVRPAFSNDGQWAAFLIGVSEDKAETLRENSQPVPYKLGVMNLSTAQTDTIPGISSFAFSASGRYIAMSKTKPKDRTLSSTDLIIRDLTTGTNQIIGNVDEYAFSEEQPQLAVLISASEKLGNGVQLHNLDEKTIRVLDSDTTTYSKLQWNDESTALAFFKERSDDGFEDPTQLVYAFQNMNKSPRKTVFDQRHFSAFGDSMRVVNYRDPEWSDDGQRLFFGVQKWAAKTASTDSTMADSSKVDSTQSLNDDLDPSNVEVWHWQDADIQPRQELMANNNRRKNHLSAWHLNDNRFVQLGAEKYDLVQLTGDQKHAVAYDSSPYEPAFEEDWRDAYLLDVATGDSLKILSRTGYLRPSPGGRYLLYFDEQNWWSYDINTNTKTNLTGGINTRFQNYKAVNGRENARPWGSGQWAEDDAWVLLYDEYDAYRVRPDGGSAKNITNATERRIRYRQQRLNTEEDYIEKGAPVIFSMYGDTTKMRGYARWNDDLETLVYEPAMFSRLTKADDAGTFVYQKETAMDSPDFFRVDASFSSPQALTHTNPQQSDFYWGDDQLITYTNKSGEQLQGRLLYPANYEPGKTYPMITYIYEKRSQTTHSYSPPSRTSAYNFRRFSSEGYFVFQPDITYRLRDPGISAVESVVPAVKKVLETDMIDEEKLGLTGHSWGAYQTSFIVTQTDLFNSAVAGAPLTNMVSMYNSIYWNSGTTDAKIFETSQGRFPDPWWIDRQKFIDNSPIFNLDTMNTPLLVEFGTDDGAVDFNQGVELYNTMRRMQKPFVMLVYEGENHGLARKENQIDYATRAFEWHEHFLLGKEPADWITDGLPYLQRPAMQNENEK